MRIGVITDVHNNLPALDAVLERLKCERCDKIICCGDIIGIGPYPEETVNRLMDIDGIIAVQGNHESYLSEHIPASMSLSEAEHHRWEHSRLSEKSRAFLRSLPYISRFKCSGITVTAVHYSINEKNEFINYTPYPSGEQLEKMFAFADGNIVCYGHNHRADVQRYNGKIYFNCGSLGCPAPDKNIARAGIIDINKEIKIKVLNVEYDVGRVIADIGRLNYPAADEIKKLFYGVE